MKPATANRSGELNGYLDRDSKIKGDLVFEETFRIDGPDKDSPAECHSWSYLNLYRKPFSYDYRFIGRCA